MIHHLSDTECRIIGVLMEKSITTPEQYPLTVHALLGGCNQKSNRYPQTTFTEDELKAGVNSLMKKRLLTMTTGFGNRVDKVSHRFCNTEFSDIKLTEHQFAVITELFLRGPQTPGELRGRCQRLAKFDDLSDVESTLSSLLAYQPDPLIAAMPRESGKREVRYMHCFGIQPGADGAGKETAPDNSRKELSRQVNELTQIVNALSQRVDELESQLNQLSH